MLAGAALFVLAAIAVGIVLVTGGDSNPAPPSTSVADNVLPDISPTSGGSGKRDAGKKDSGGGDKGGQNADHSGPAGGGGGGRDLTAEEKAASKVDCPYGREQCKQLWTAWKNRASTRLDTGPNAKCPYDRAQCKQLKQAWKQRASTPLKTGGDPKEIECPYDREQCKQLWKAWQAATG